ncbi:PH domain-containing protein [Halobacillus salinus]|uniref:PH domain-containing protein n=1 Tax=Halobacillus salinus TaxID=192814 RepID=UPI0015919F6D|nr:PH domain-containing protein [Halobacillus salinus]
MVYRSKVDRLFVLLMVLIVSVIGLASFFPLFLGEELERQVLLISVLFVAMASFVLWCGFSVAYELKSDCLCVKGGPFRTQIPFGRITKVTDTRDILTGYRLLSSRDAIEIHYNDGVFGSVKISPKDKEAFMAELRKRNPKL